MAIISPSVLITGIQGKMNSTVFQMWKGQIIARRLAKPRHTLTARRARYKGFVSTIAGCYDSLTTPQKLGWACYSELLPNVMSGANAFLGLNSVVLNADHPQLCMLFAAPCSYALPNAPAPFEVAHSPDSGRFFVYWDTPSAACYFVQGSFAPQTGYSNAKYPAWRHAEAVAAAMRMLSLDGSGFPEGTVMRLRARTMDFHGQVSPWTPIGSVTKGTTFYFDPWFFHCDRLNHRIQKRLKSDLSFVAKIGTQGSGDNQFDEPYDITADDTHLYIADSANFRLVKRLKSDLSFVAEIGTQGSGNDQFNRPVGIDADSTHLFISDHYNYRIQKRLKSDLSFVAKIGTFGSGDNQFNRPRDITVDDTHVFIADRLNHRIQKRLKSDLSFVAKIGTQGSGDNQFNEPWGIAVDDTHIFICDRLNYRIQKRLKSDLSFVAKIGTQGSGDNQFNEPRSIAVDDTHLFISDRLNYRIHKRLKSDLSFVAKIGTPGSGDDQFNEPYGITTQAHYA